jgi:hypothetical protein
MTPFLLVGWRMASACSRAMPTCPGASVFHHASCTAISMGGKVVNTEAESHEMGRKGPGVSLAWCLGP